VLLLRPKSSGTWRLSVRAECLRLQDQTAAKALCSFETSRNARQSSRRHSNRPQPHPLLFTIQQYILVTQNNQHSCDSNVWIERVVCLSVCHYLLLFSFVILITLHCSMARSYNCEKRLLTLRLLMSYIYIYIYIWSTHSWCF